MLFKLIPSRLSLGLRPVMGMAIDLGTQNTLVHVRGQGVVLNEPSVIAVERATGRLEAIGMGAKRMLGKTPETIRVDRPVRNGVISDIDLAELMLRSFIVQVAEKRFFRLRPRLVVGVPSGITEIEKRAIRQSASAAGAREVWLLPEPMAAAIGCGLPVSEPQGSMVLDIGGGTSEIAVIALNGIVCDSSIRIAGDEIDQQIIVNVKRHHNVQIGEPTAERVKFELGSAMPREQEAEMEVTGRDIVSGTPKRFILTSSEVREWIQDPVRQICEAVMECLEDTPPELSSDIFDHGIVMTGGGALIQGLGDLITQQTGVKVIVDDEPLNCVARGAAAVRDDFKRYKPVLMA